MNNTNNEEDYVDEDSGWVIEEFLKIHDPDTKEVQYKGRT